MACYYLRPAWKEKERNQNGKHEITFSRRTSQLDADFHIPCGKCEGCRADQAMDWAIRIYHETQSYDRNCFVTLTYNEETCPDSLQKPDFQKFIKRMRKHSSRPIRYFAVGEYGEETHRPHYHAIIFNEDWRGGAYDINDNGLYGNVILDRLWGLGNVTIGDANASSACYVSGYVNKKAGDTDTFKLSSTRPPIGWTWAQKHQDTMNRTKQLYFDGRIVQIPKVYYEWFDPSLYRPGRVDLDGIKAERALHVETPDSRFLRNKQINKGALSKLKKGAI